MEQELSTQQGRGGRQRVTCLSTSYCKEREREREAAVKRRMEMREEVEQQVH